jgi:hypothetical protein
MGINREADSMNTCKNYADRLSALIICYDWKNVDLLVDDLVSCWANGGEE